MARILAALALFTLTSPALAQSPSQAQPPTCDELRAFSSNAATNFESLRGERLTVGVYKTTTSLSPFNRCTVIDKSMGETTFAAVICSQEGTREASATDVYSILAARVKSCYPRWTESKKDPGASPSYPNTSTIKFQHLVEKGDHPPSIFVGLARTIEGAQTIYSVTVSFSAAYLDNVS